MVRAFRPYSFDCSISGIFDEVVTLGGAINGSSSVGNSACSCCFRALSEFGRLQDVT